MSGNLIPVILCGGAGTRLWPMSRKLLPKQFLPLITERTMLQETALRAAEVSARSAPYVICSEEHRFLAAEQMLEAGIAPAGIVLEPVARNTAPALAAAALAIAVCRQCWSNWYFVASSIRDSTECADSPFEPRTSASYAKTALAFTSTIG